MYGPRPRLAAFWIGLLKDSSREQYITALRIFSEWALVMCPGFWDLDEESQDFALCDYTLECRDGEEHGPQHCATTIAAVQRCFGRRRKYHAASMTVEGWRGGLEVRQAPPAPAVVVYAFATLLAAAGRVECAGVTLICFTALLRISEALGLCVADVLLPGDHHMGRVVLLLLRTAKRDAPDSARVVVSELRFFYV